MKLFSFYSQLLFYFSKVNYECKEAVLQNFEFSKIKMKFFDSALAS